MDTSVLVAALQARHQDHARCRDALHDLLLASSVVVPEPALVETYSVLTRIPPPFRMNPVVVLRLLRETLSGHAQVAPVPEGRSWDFLSAAAERGVAGGATYDDRILFCALETGARRLLTLNLRDFERLAQGRVEVVSP
ncbi:MAG TPA: PIN domain-containing protein [Thermoanaerobaculia bacterium]|nr:PIN domain-containing protein [Thermoanaerobaculia bacterium]